MLGVYDYTVVLTYVSLMVSVGGMMFAVNGHLHLGAGLFHEGFLKT